MGSMIQENIWGPSSTTFNTHIKMVMAPVKQHLSLGNITNNILEKAHAWITRYILRWRTPQVGISTSMCGLRAYCMEFTSGNSGYPGKYRVAHLLADLGLGWLGWIWGVPPTCLDSRRNNVAVTEKCVEVWRMWDSAEWWLFPNNVAGVWRMWNSAEWSFDKQSTRLAKCKSGRLDSFSSVLST